MSSLGWRLRPASRVLVRTGAGVGRSRLVGVDPYGRSQSRGGDDRPPRIRIGSACRSQHPGHVRRWESEAGGRSPVEAGRTTRGDYGEEEAMSDPREVADAWMKAFNAHDEAGMRALTAADVKMKAPPEMLLGR